MGQRHGDRALDTCGFIQTNKWQSTQSRTAGRQKAAVLSAACSWRQGALHQLWAVSVETEGVV